MGWFPIGQDDSGGWRLDIVALLAVTGESFIGEHAQALTSTWLCLLPRIMPAPHALLQPRRPASLPAEVAKLAGVHSGMILDSVGFFANIIHPLNEMRPFDFRVLEIRHRTGLKPPIPLTKGTLRNVDTEVGANSQPGRSLRRSRPLANPSLLDDEHIGLGRTPWLLPIHLLSIISSAMTIGLITAGILWQDGTAVVAVSLLSMATSVIGYAAWWEPRLGFRRDATASRGDMVIRTTESAFILVRCNENIARELYSGSQECRYMVTGIKYRVFMTLGAVLMMPSVILLGNCSFNMQALVGSAFLFLNVAYWSIGLLPLHRAWNFTRYDVRDVTPNDARNADKCTFEDPREGSPSFTRTLWYVIREVKGQASWVEPSGAIPGTPEWRQWLSEAVNAARDGNRNWPAVTRKNQIMAATIRGQNRHNDNSSSGEDIRTDLV